MIASLVKLKHALCEPKMLHVKLETALWGLGKLHAKLNWLCVSLWLSFWLSYLHLMSDVVGRCNHPLKVALTPQK